MLNILVYSLLFLGLAAVIITAVILAIELIAAVDEATKKHQCNSCQAKLAQWYYLPCDGGSGDRYRCDDCVERGCSCNIDPDTGEEVKDGQGRLFPCCEWDFSETGWEVEDEDERD